MTSSIKKKKKSEPYKSSQQSLHAGIYHFRENAPRGRKLPETLQIVNFWCRQPTLYKKSVVVWPEYIATADMLDFFLEGKNEVSK